MPAQLCRQITAKYSKILSRHAANERSEAPSYLGYVWCRRTDELVDGPGAELTTPETLDRWEASAESLFAGRPFDDLDVLSYVLDASCWLFSPSGYDCRSADGLVPVVIRREELNTTVTALPEL